MSAEVIALPREGFVIGPQHCAKSGPEDHLMCLAPKGHEGEHVWCDWRGCRCRVPGWTGTVRFGGFVR